MRDDFARAVLYRRVYGKTRDRLARVVAPETPEEIRASPLEGLAPLDSAVAADPETLETIEEAVEDALFDRRPRW